MISFILLANYFWVKLIIFKTDITAFIIPQRSLEKVLLKIDSDQSFRIRSGTPES